MARNIDSTAVRMAWTTISMSSIQMIATVNAAPISSTVHRRLGISGGHLDQPVAAQLHQLLELAGRAGIGDLVDLDGGMHVQQVALVGHTWAVPPVGTSPLAWVGQSFSMVSLA